MKKPIYKVGDIIHFLLLDSEPVEAMAVEQQGDTMLFCLVDCLQDRCQMSPQRTRNYKGGYNESNLKRNLNKVILKRFPQKIKEKYGAF